MKQISQKALPIHCSRHIQLKSTLATKCKLRKQHTKNIYSLVNVLVFTEIQLIIELYLNTDVPTNPGPGPPKPAYLPNAYS